MTSVLNTSMEDKSVEIEVERSKTSFPEAYGKESFFNSRKPEAKEGAIRDASRLESVVDESRGCEKLCLEGTGIG